MISILRMFRLAGVFLVIGIGIQSYSQQTYLGVDLSYVNELEDSGVLYYNAENNLTDPYELLADKGANLVRLRLWHNPQWTNYCNFNDVVISAGRAKAAGMSVLLDFQLSDFWADPSRQWRPADWNDIDNNVAMSDSVYNYVFTVLDSLADLEILPEMVQIGNEINCNILIKRTDENIDASSPGGYPIDWDRQKIILHKGIEAVRTINIKHSTDVKTVIHVAQPENAEWWFRDAISNGLEGFDIIGMSYYPQWSEYSIEQLGETVSYFAEQYQKDVMVVETGYPWTTNGDDNAGNVLGNSSRLSEFGSTFSPEIQRNFLIELQSTVLANGGLGIIYWEAAWVSSACETYWGTGSHYENAALFDFANKIHAGADFLSFDYSKENTYPVNFIVDATGIDTTNGIFITGDFTGENWQFIRMTHLGDFKFEFVAQIPGNTSGAFIFYNNNVWDDQYRETIPAACAGMWDTHRKYEIEYQPVSYNYNWGKCSFGSSNNKYAFAREIEIIPNPVANFICLPDLAGIHNLSVLDIQAKICLKAENPGNALNVEHLEPGIYSVRFESGSKLYYSEFIKH
ncbi:MAG: glycosyl hydrolase 53 family protein [Prolixibacteraceae bacterium]|nr:glycosyl hydrolase 53 family protein [Prolixibacteraceae bacterium]